MKGVLVVPNVSMQGWNRYDREGRRNNSLPHGLLSIATELQRAGHEIAIVDLRQHRNWSEAIRAILDHQPIFVGVGPMTVDFPVALELFERIKSVASEITTVMGGVHATIRPDDALESRYVDFVVTGEAEWTLQMMVDDLFVGYKRLVKGIPPDLDALLPINRELVDYKGGELMHGAAWNSKYPYVTMMVGRGCPFKCTFCAPVSETLFGKSPRLRSVSHVMLELKDMLRRYQPAYIEFIDDLFTLRKLWVAEFLDSYPYVCEGIPFNVASRADAIADNPAMFSALKKIGLDTVNVGLESGCQRHLDFLGKNTTVEQNVEACKILRGLGIKVVGNIIHGIPGETASETLETVKLIQQHVDFYSPSFLTPYPGCDLHETLGDELVITDYAKMNRHATTPKIKDVPYDAIKAILASEGLR